MDYRAKLIELLDAIDAVDSAHEQQKIGWSLEKDAALRRLGTLRREARAATADGRPA